MLATFGATSLRLSPPPGDRLETARQLDLHVTGPESNAAVAARRAGVPVTHATVQPDTPLGRRAVGELRAHDVDVSVTWRDGRQGLTFYEHGAAPRPDDRVEDRGASAFAALERGTLPLDVVGEADCAYLSGATPGYSTAAAEAAARFLRAARDEEGTTAFSLTYRPKQWSPEEARETLTGFFPAVDVLVATASDAATVLDRDGPASEVAHALATEHGFETVALVRERTTVAWHDATLFEFPVVDAEEMDPTGATDAFTGTFLARLVEGSDTETALRYGTAAHGLARTVAGPLVTFSEAELGCAAERREASN